VLFDYAALRGARVRPLAQLNDSKQVDPEERERLYHAVLASATRIAVRVIASAEIDREGLHRSNLWGLRTVLSELHRDEGACLVDGFRLGPLAPPHRAVVDGDTKSAAIAAASVVAKVTRDRLMRRMDAVYPRYGFSSHVGYITPEHTRAVLAHGPCPQHRRSFAARAYRVPLPVPSMALAPDTGA
jgi:ribonuclease HII